MLRAIAPIVSCALMVAVVACSKRDPVADDANNTSALPVSSDAANTAQNAADPTGAPREKSSGTTEASDPSRMIPASLQGRWGLTPMDCTSTKGDAKGLLIVSPTDLKFYESRAVPTKTAQSGTDSITGDFNYTGEGQTWTKFESLKAKGDELVRTESNPTASFTYARCK
jgi:hypothetical protein